MRQLLSISMVFLLASGCAILRSSSVQGSFADKGGQQTSGTFRIERHGKDLQLILSDDFQTGKGPDLHIVLSPTPADLVDSDTAMATGALIIEPLKSPSGSQTYHLPADVDLKTFGSVLVHCVKYTHLYGAAPLN